MPELIHAWFSLNLVAVVLWAAAVELRTLLPGLRSGIFTVMHEGEAVEP